MPHPRGSRGLRQIIFRPAYEKSRIRRSRIRMSEVSAYALSLLIAGTRDAQIFAPFGGECAIGITHAMVDA